MTAAPAEAPVSDDEAARLFAVLLPYKFAVLAVSGGPDSLALMHLAARWAARLGEAAPKLSVATVDHAARAGSADEAAFVGQQTAKLGLAHKVLTWSGKKPATGFMEAARRARYRLLGNYAAEVSAGKRTALVTAHHLDDQAETFLMRLARGSGIDGLAGMRAVRRLGDGDDLDLVRPFLMLPKERLLATLRSAEMTWIDDPSNTREDFERVRIRQGLEGLRAFGIDSAAIARSADRLAQVRDALDAGVEELHHSAAVEGNGPAIALFDAALFQKAPVELKVRLLGTLIAAHGGETPQPQRAEIERLVEALAGGQRSRHTLGGAVVSLGDRCLRVYREFGRITQIAVLQPGSSVQWDGRFVISAAPEASSAVNIRALGAHGLAALRPGLGCNLPMPATAAHALPAIWRQDTLIGAPHLKDVIATTASELAHFSVQPVRKAGN